LYTDYKYIQDGKVMSVRTLVGVSVLSSLLAPSAAWSLGLGDITVDTTLNQPLRAQIKLLSVSLDELNNMQVSLASQATFERVGIERPFVLTQLHFQPKQTPDRGSIIEVTTKQPIREPFLDFLVEVEWPNGRLLREYTVLLNPPVFMDQRGGAVGQTPMVAPEQAAPAAANAAEHSMRQAARMEGPMKAVSAREGTAQASDRRANPQVTASKPVEYSVASGDTLYQIAQRYLPSSDVSVSQMMVTIWRANPDAFSQGNINNLKAGAILRIPADQDIAAVDEQEAMAEIRRQNNLWRDFQAQLTAAVSSEQSGQTFSVPSSSDNAAQQKVSATHNSRSETQNSTSLNAANEDAIQAKSPKGGRLEIMASDQDGAHVQVPNVDGDAENGQAQPNPALIKELAASRQVEIESLKSKMAELESVLAKQRRIISLQSKTLASLQQRVEEGRNIPNAQAQPLSVNQHVGISDESALTVGTTAGDTDRPSTDSTTTTSAKAAADTLRDQTKTPTLPPSVSLMREMFANPARFTGMGIGAALLLALVWLVIRRAASKRGETIDLVSYQGDSGDTVSAQAQTVQPHFDVEAEAQSSINPAMPSAPATTVLPEQPHTESAAVQVQSASPQDDEAQSRALGDDTLAEADVYIAYGLYQQAQDLLKEAIRRNPNNDDYRLKLLEAYYAGKDSASFDAEAQHLYQALGGKPNPLWERTVAMGREISPHNLLFSNSTVDTQDPRKQASSMSGSGPINRGRIPRTG
jgi:pilus assembly protein FimV